MARTVNTGLQDAEQVNESPSSSYIYKDINLFFTKHPVSDDVTSVTDVQAVKRSVRNLVLTNQGERLFHPEIGGNVRGSIFNIFSPITQHEIRTAVFDVIRNFEPRVIVEDVIVNDPDGQDLDASRLRIMVHFSLQNVPNETHEVEILLNRIR